jgi:hypothetical protein
MRDPDKKRPPARCQTLPAATKDQRLVEVGIEGVAHLIDIDVGRLPLPHHLLSPELDLAPGAGRPGNKRLVVGVRDGEYHFQARVGPDRAPEVRIMGLQVKQSLIGHEGANSEASGLLEDQFVALGDDSLKFVYYQVGRTIRLGVLEQVIQREFGDFAHRTRLFGGGEPEVDHLVLCHDFRHRDTLLAGGIELGVFGERFEDSDELPDMLPVFPFANMLIGQTGEMLKTGSLIAPQEVLEGFARFAGEIRAAKSFSMIEVKASRNVSVL